MLSVHLRLPDHRCRRLYTVWRYRCVAADITALEYRLLLTFLSHPGQTLTRGQLLEGIWDVAGNFVNDNTLSVYIKRLRDKLEMPGHPLISTVRGMGYRLEVDGHDKK
jgi:DNA-binding response OmpR family regulator